jgi:hypothetical protein
VNGIKAVKKVASGADIEDQTTRAWADEQARLKAATKAAARAAKQTIKEAAKKPTATARSMGKGP